MLTRNETKHERVEFILNKIREIKIAKFSAEINSLLRLPNNIITTLQIDDDGSIWFFTSCYGNYGPFVDKNFYASLEYYHKGSDGHLRIEGNACIIEDDNKESFIIRNDNYDLVLIKLKIAKAEYFENKHILTTSFTETVKNIFHELFFPETTRELIFEPLK